MAINVIEVDGGHTFDYTTTGNVTSGTLLLIGNVPGVALESAATGAVIGVQVGCRAKLTKKAASGTAVTVGGFVTYTATGGVNKVHGTSATGAVMIGYGCAAATTAATTAEVRLINQAAIRIG